jgi:hypothetical protein
MRKHGSTISLFAKGQSPVRNTLWHVWSGLAHTNPKSAFIQEIQSGREIFSDGWRTLLEKNFTSVGIIQVNKSSFIHVIY